MSDFLFKTRHNSNPQGKPRVYFTCHAEDFKNCFGKIANDILTLQDCAIYYLDDMTAPIEEADLETTLGYMSLFVVPITHNLLTTPNRALDHDIAYAQNTRIPILPIAMDADSKLNELYGKCELMNGYQYLVRTSNDSTEKSYTDKLDAYLENVLVSSELTERVRSAFDAYIFLSYRKKDRRYANELMKRIHEIPELRDVAIWYDEFLTPGENFRENIAQAIKSCSIFTLLVTPSILEEPNFVADTEYPMAMEAVMCVIPAEMEKTERDALTAKFRDIPECINPNDPEHLTQRILENLPFTVVHINKAEQNFLIGLAYLKGIDVEINRERGIELITAAAEADYPEAVEKLYKLYSGEEGYGYKSHNQAIIWGKKLIEIRSKEWGKEHPNTQTLIAKFAAIYSEIGDSHYATELLEDVYQVRCRTLGENHPHTLTALHNLAVEYSKLGQLKKALELNQRIYALRCEILGETHPETLTTLYNLGTMHLDIGNTSDGMEVLEKAYIQSRAALGEVHPTTYQLSCKLADIYLRAGDIEAVSRYIDPLIEAYATEYGPNNSYITYLIQIFDDTGCTALVRNEHDKAVLYLGKAYELYYHYWGPADTSTQCTFSELIELLPDVSGNTEKDLIKKIKTMLKRLKCTDFGDFSKTLTDKQWRRMNNALERALADKTPKIQAECWTLYYDCVHYFCGRWDKKATSVLKKLETILTEDLDLPD